MEEQKENPPVDTDTSPRVESDNSSATPKQQTTECVPNSTCTLPFLNLNVPRPKSPRPCISWLPGDPNVEYNSDGEDYAEEW